MFLILHWAPMPEGNSSAQMAWRVWYPYRKDGFPSVGEAEKAIEAAGDLGHHYHIVELTRPLTARRLLVAAVVD